MLVKVRPAPAFPSASLPQQTFEWSLKPVMAWMRCIGVDMAHASPHVTTWPAGWKGRLMITLGWLCLAHELLGHTWNSHALWTFLHRLNPPYNVTTEKKLQPALTEMSCYIIDTANLAIHCWGVHLTAAFIARPRWPGLMEAFQRLDGLFSVEFHRRLRRSSWLAIGLVILVELYIVGAVLTAMVVPDQTSLGQLTMNLTLTLTSTYRLSCTMLYVVVARSLSAVFRHISTGRDELRIEGVKRLHSLGCGCVDQVNACFGLILLIDCLCISVSLIISCFQAFLSFRMGNQYAGWGKFYMLYMTQLFVQLWLIGYAAVQLRHDGMEVLKAVRRSAPLPGHRDWMKAGALMNQVYHSAPSISAAGLFEVNLKLIPALIGTTMTYLVILYQFYSSER